MKDMYFNINQSTRYRLYCICITQSNNSSNTVVLDISRFSL